MSQSTKERISTSQTGSGASSGSGRASSRRDALALGALAVLCFFLYVVGLDNFPFIDPSEAYYVEACREMLQIGNYITPHLNYQIYFSKPILNFWLIAASYKIFGISEFSARLPFALLSSMLVLTTYGFTRRLISARAGFMAGFCLATSPLLLLVSRKSSIDIVFTFFLDVAVFATALAIAKKGKWSWLAIYAALGLGVLAKGPATLILYGVGMVAFLTVARPSFANLKTWIAALKPLFGFVVFGLVVLPWHIAVSMATDGLFLKVFFWYENLARFQGHTNLGKVRYWFYLSVIGYGLFPWVALLLPSISNALLGDKKTIEHSDDCSHAKQNLPVTNAVTRVFDVFTIIRNRAAEDDRARALILITAWSLTTFAFFSVSKTQLATYILPVIAPCCVLVAASVESWLVVGYDKLGKPERFWLQLTSALFAIAGIAAIPAAILFCLKVSDASPVVQALVIATSVIFFIGGLKQFLAMRKRQLETALLSLALTTAAALAIGTPLSFYVAVNKTQGHLKAISLEAGKSKDKIAMFGNYMPSAMYYSRKPVDTFFHGHQLLPVKTPPPGKENRYPYVPQAILVRDSEFQTLQSTSPCPLVLVSKHGNWGLYHTPGFELESVRTLEDTFADPVAFKIIVSGESPTGPLTVPYAAGKLYEKYWNQ